MGTPRVIIPLDVSSAETALESVVTLAPHVHSFKVGLQLTERIGLPVAVKIVRDHGGKCLVDHKLHDIPNTVVEAVKAIVDHGASAFTIHASAGPEVLQAAAKVKGNVKMYAVTVLTSMDTMECLMLYKDSPEMTVRHLAEVALAAGADGIICSPKEVALLRQTFGLNFLIITPGVRPSWASTDDQSRIMTPGDAIKAGADFLVVGRPITQPPTAIGSSLDAVQCVNEEIRLALET